MKPIVIRSTVAAALGSFLFGFDSAVINGAEKALQSQFGLGTFLHGFVMASALIGTIVGCLCTEKPVDTFGRKKTLFGIALLYLFSALWSAFATGWITLSVARFIGGLGIGAASAVVPLYVAEISPARLRGRLVAVAQLNVMTGIFVSFLSNYIVNRVIPAHPDAWRWMLGVEAVPAALFLGMLFTIVESPRWLVKVGRVADAAEVLKRLGTEADIPAKIAEIQDSLGAATSNEPLFQRRYFYPIFLAFAIAAFNQLSGINALMYYTTRIFEMSGVSQDTALLRSVVIGVTGVVFTVVGLSLIDRAGRRALIIAGSIGYIISLVVATWCFAHYGKNFDAAGGGIVFVALIVFQASHCFGQGAVIWVFISEIFPNAVRAKGQSFGSLVHWVGAATVTWTFPAFAERSGAWPFGFFALCMV
ncbi:MAG: sugar porter family MFS transporter, partial [Opitutaceae bacterium]|nr:sugar porter family MFS transporter [Opitutaceae bacterium]